METATTELVRTEEKRDAKGRRIRAAAQRAQLLAAYEASGLTRAEFARREGLNYSTFATWTQTKRSKASAHKGTRGFAEVPLSAALFAGLEVRLPDGTLVRGRVAGEVVELVKALRA